MQACGTPGRLRRSRRSYSGRALGAMGRGGFRCRGDRLKAAVIGCGFFPANHLHVWRDLVKAAGVELAAVCRPRRGQGGQAAREFGGRHYSDARAMLEAEARDFVDVVTTMPSHRALVELTAAHRVRHDPTAGRWSGPVRSAGVPLMVHENFRFQTPIFAVREVLTRGTIGRPFFAVISWRTGFDVYANQPYLAKDERFIILDLVIHCSTWRAACSARRCGSPAGPRASARASGARTCATLLLDARGRPRPPSSMPPTRRRRTRTRSPRPDRDRRQRPERSGWAGLRADRHDPGRQRAPRGRARRCCPGRAVPWHGVQESVLTTQRHWVKCLRHGRRPETSGADNLKTFASARRHMLRPRGRTVTPCV